MKRFLLLLLTLLLLAGCGREDILSTDDQTEPLETEVVTEPTIPWVEEKGMAWDAEGILKEMPLTIPDSMHYSAIMNFDGDLLLWSIDDHLEQCMLEMVLVELDDGSVTATCDFPVSEFVAPQCLDDMLYICDGKAGLVTALNKELQTTEQWEIEQTDGGLNMGGNGILYHSTSDEHLMATNLSTGETYPALEGDPAVGWVSIDGSIMVIRCYLPETGAPDFVAMDLMTGTYTYAGAPRNAGSASKAGDTWMYEYYIEGYSYELYSAGNEPKRIVLESSSVTLLKEGYLLNTSADTTILSLHALDGSVISACRVAEREMGYIDNRMIWNEAQNGYFLILRNYGDTARLLFWDVNKTIEHEALTLEDIPEPEEYQQRLEERAAELGKKYGVNILVGEECDTQFDEFYATQITDFEKVSAALSTLDKALSAYPEGFIRQLRYDTVYGITIQLICDLQADGSGRTGGGYAAFTQTRWEDALMVIDIEDSSEQTYYHEFSHIIDKYLEWDAGQRSDALYSESGWIDFNPGWFGGYTYDYSWEQNLSTGGAFIDGYATISPTEDRARVMEYAMLEWTSYNFEQGTTLSRKLDYYARCIRDAFDTTGWTGAPLWEQHLR